MNLYQITDEDKSRIHATFGTSSKQIEEDLEIIKEWLKKQPHLPQQLPYDNFIKQVLMNNKFNVTRTKDTIEKYFSLKGSNQQLYEALNIKPLLLPSQNPLAMIPMPRLGPNNERIIVLFARPPNGPCYEYWQYVQALLVGTEFGLRYNCSNGVSSIVDMRNMGLEFLKIIDPNQCVKLVVLLMNAFSSRLMSINVIYVHSFVHLILTALKSAMKPKIFNRIKFHKDLASLQEVLPPKYLPEDYGGTAESLRDLEEKFDQAFEEHRDFFRTIGHCVSDESLRIGEVEGDFCGTKGTFKKLDID